MIQYVALLLAAYNLPGANDTSKPDPGDAVNGVQGVARDRNGFWYVAYSNASRTDILLAYTTTTTPSSASDWGLVTLVDNGNTGVIPGAEATASDGDWGCIAIGTDNVLQLLWRVVAGDQGAWSKCTDLSALTVRASWATAVNTNGTASIYNPHSMVLDSQNVAHVIGICDDPDVAYSKFNTATNAFLPLRILMSANNITDGIGAIAIDANDALYVAGWTSGDAAGGRTVRFLACVNATATTPGGSTWRNLGQTTTTADTLSATPNAAGPAICVDARGVVHVAWVDNATSLATVADGVLNQGWTTSAVRDGDGTAKHPLKLVPDGYGNAWLLSVRRTTAASPDDLMVTPYRADGSWGSPSVLLARGAAGSQGLWAETRPPARATSTLWAMLDDASNRTVTSWDERLALEPARTPGAADDRPAGACFLSAARRR